MLENYLCWSSFCVKIVHCRVWNKQKKSHFYAWITWVLWVVFFPVCSCHLLLGPSVSSPSPGSSRKVNLGSRDGKMRGSSSHVLAGKKDEGPSPTGLMNWKLNNSVVKWFGKTLFWLWARMVCYQASAILHLNLRAKLKNCSVPPVKASLYSLKS